MSTSSRDRLVLAGIGAGELCCTILAASVISRDETYPLYLAAYLGMGAFWLAGCSYVLHRARDTASNRAVVIVVAVALRAILLPTDPTLSDDIFRYVWDGRTQLAGINPYLYPPDAPALDRLRDPIGADPSLYAGINNKDIPTIYPPVMQVAFAAATSISDNVKWMKAFFVGSDLAIVFILIRLLGSLGLHRVRFLIYAWSPLVVVEVAGSGHNDALAVSCLMAALLAIVQQRDRVAMGLIALTGLAKLLGFALMPLFVRAVRWPAIAIVPAVTLAFCLPYAGAGADAFKGLTEYGLRWRGNDSLFHVLFEITGSLDSAKIVVAVVLVALVLGLVAVNASPLRGTYLTVGAVLLFMPTVHPWYLLWMAPFLAIYASPAWLFLMVSIALGYHSAYLSEPGQPWEDTLWVKALEYVPFFVLSVSSVALRVRREGASLRTALGLHSPR